MKKVTKNMVKYWINDEDDAIKVIMEIANSKNDVKPWTPVLLYDDIIQTWKTKEKK